MLLSYDVRRILDLPKIIEVKSGEKVKIIDYGVPNGYILALYSIGPISWYPDTEVIFYLDHVPLITIKREIPEPENFPRVWMVENNLSVEIINNSDEDHNFMIDFNAEIFPIERNLEIVGQLLRRGLTP